MQDDLSEILLEKLEDAIDRFERTFGLTEDRAATVEATICLLARVLATIEPLARRRTLDRLSKHLGRIVETMVAEAGGPPLPGPEPVNIRSPTGQSFAARFLPGQTGQPIHLSRRSRRR